MAAVQPVVAMLNETAASRRIWNDAWLGLLAGMAGGLLQGRILHSSERRRRTDLGTEQRPPVLVSSTGRKHVEPRHARFKRHAG